MGSVAIKMENRRYSPEEFLDVYPTLEGRYELHNGEIVEWYMMAGSTEPHALIASNVTIAIGSALRGKPCRVYGSDLLVRIANKSSYRHPDLSIVCGETEFDHVDKGRRMAVSNPRVVFEIMSDSSEKLDRGEKFEEYRDIDPLMEYVVVSQHKPMIEAFRRNEDGTWGILAIVTGLDATLRLTSVGLDVKLSDIYAGVTFPAAPEKPNGTDGQTAQEK